MGASSAVLIVDDDERGRERLGREFQARGWVPLLAAEAMEALALARTTPPDLVLLAELDALEAIRELHPQARVVAIGFNSIARAVDAVRRGADDYRCKPVHAIELVEPRGPRIVKRTLPAGPSSLALNEREYIHEILGACHGNISAAARTLGIHRRTLQRKLQKQL